MEHQRDVAMWALWGVVKNGVELRYATKHTGRWAADTEPDLVRDAIQTSKSSVLAKQ